MEDHFSTTVAKVSKARLIPPAESFDGSSSRRLGDALSHPQISLTRLNYKEAVRQGIITPDQNPFFVKAWKEQDGRVSADQYNSDLLVALSTGPFAQSTDHADTDNLLNTF